jgi:cell filamentation protein, protein adenylyltransferase
LTTPTVTQALGELQKLRIVRETTGRARGRIFAYVRYLDALNAEIDDAAGFSGMTGARCASLRE